MSYAYMCYQPPSKLSLFGQHYPLYMLFFPGFHWAIFLSLHCWKHSSNFSPCHHIGTLPSSV
uniref:Protein EXPORTIN 1A n=1 Tax=Rhizophora mucronata TaxID=61149 RepID=A0A2P2LZY1_RHIMU